MENSAPRKTQVLITDAGSFLGRELAKSLLLSGCQVHALAKSKIPQELLANRDFTLLELDLSQPLPSHLPKFDFVFYLSHEASPFTPGLSQMPQLSFALTNTLALSHLDQAKIIIFLPITTDPTVYDYLAKTEEEKQRLTLFLLGDLYGPGVSLDSQGHLSNLIAQAVKTDKIILENEGQNIIYPAFISDVILAIFKFTFNPGNDFKKTHILASENPRTALSIAYELQKAARLVLGKELSLFFSGNTPASLQSQQIIKVSDFDFSPKIELEEGLMQTFDYFAKILPKPAVSPPPAHVYRHMQAVQSKREEPKRKFKTITAKISAPSLHRKNIILVIAIVFVLFIGKTALDLYLGVSGLKSAEAAAKIGDFKTAQSSAQNAAGSIKSAHGKVNLLLTPFSLIFSQKTQGISYIFDSAENIAVAVADLSAGASTLAKDVAIISQKDAKSDGFDLESPHTNFEAAYFASARANGFASEAIKNAPFSSKIVLIQKAAADLNNLSSSAYDFSNLLGDIAGSETPKSYLLLLENNTELRPGGGFIGNIGVVDFASGRLKNISVDDVYNVDGQLKEKITPPAQIKDKLGTDNFYLRDSGWSPDFQLNSQIARDFFKKETGKDVDGVISLDLTFLQKVLEATGPVKLPDFNETISAQNIFEKGEYYSEVGFFPGSTQKRDFFGALTRTIINSVLSNLTANSKSPNRPSLLSLMTVFKDSLNQKHIMATFDSPNLAAYVRTHDWNRPIPPATFNLGDDSSATHDFLALSEANLGANKVNRVVDRKISYEMTIGRDADLVANLKITYTNNSQANTWPGGTYVNFLRVYTPGLITLLSVNGSDKIDPKVVQVSTLGNLSSISTYVEVPIKSTKEITFSYRLPKSIKLETAPIYDLYVQKQPGTNQDPLELKFNLPAYLVAKSVNGADQPAVQNLDIKTDLLIDREFQIGVTKK